MPAKMYYDQDADLDLLKDKTIGVIGFGSQGHAHALNLHDSGVNVIVGLYPGSRSWNKVTDAGLRVDTVANVADASDIIMVLTPDHIQKQIYDQHIAPFMVEGKTLMFAHGFAIHYNQVAAPPEVDVTMIAPKGPGHLVRRVFVEGGGVPALLAIHQDASENAKEVALAYAKGIGGTRAGVLETTFLEETETDLFGEQSVLCGGITTLMQTAFEVLVEAGYQPESAYFETIHEVKLIVDLIYEGGFANMRYSISDTAEYGDLTRGPRVIDASVKDRMRGLLSDIQDGTFAREWIMENQTGRPGFDKLRARAAAHPSEEVGAELRGMMAWLNQEAD